MRLNYVSVTKRHKFKRSDERCVVRAELDCIPQFCGLSNFSFLDLFA